MVRTSPERKKDAYLAVDECWSRALGITVARAVAGASRVQRALTSICEHLAEIKSAIGTTGELADIHVKGKLLVQQREHVVGGLVSKEVDSRGDETGSPVGPVDEEVESKFAAVGMDTGPRIVDAL